MATLSRHNRFTMRTAKTTKTVRARPVILSLHQKSSVKGLMYAELMSMKCRIKEAMRKSKETGVQKEWVAGKKQEILTRLASRLEEPPVATLHWEMTVIWILMMIFRFAEEAEVGLLMLSGSVMLNSSKDNRNKERFREEGSLVMHLKMSTWTMRVLLRTEELQQDDFCKMVEET